MNNKNPWAWVPTLYFAEGVPYVAVMTISVIIYKRLGLSNTDITLYTSWLYLPWVIKPLWSPFVDMLRTKRWWILGMQILIAAALAGVAFTIPGPFWLQGSLSFFWLLAFSSATHDIAADGFYMLGLEQHEQAYFVGIRSTFYRIATIFSSGLLVGLAGVLQVLTRSISYAWSLVFYLIAGLFIALWLYHSWALPRPSEDTHRIQKTAADIITEVFLDAVKVACYAQSFGGEHGMEPAWIDFIDNWEVENYRRKVASGASQGRVEGKTVIVTGAAQGFGEGIARELMGQGANIVVADLNDVVGAKTAESLNSIGRNNRAIFVKTNVADMQSLQNLMKETICRFGALDVFVSNAGVLRAGGLEAMTPENFEFVTNINYKAYFFCAKVASHIMKIETGMDPDYFADIVQVNSKSGLRGSKANFAYAGGKFGGIGLTQSFALELAPFRVKVNSICPGNFYDGPLWSNPENGLFVQYLAAGKVPGAKTMQDVKDYYLAQVPMRKGCNPADVTKAILYAIEQTGETGQAIPVTGGQVMLS